MGLTDTCGISVLYCSGTTYPISTKNKWFSEMWLPPPFLRLLRTKSPTSRCGCSIVPASQNPGSPHTPAHNSISPVEVEVLLHDLERTEVPTHCACLSVLGKPAVSDLPCTFLINCNLYCLPQSRSRRALAISRSQPRARSPYLIMSPTCAAIREAITPS